MPAVACDSEDRVYVYSRSEHPVVVFDREGRFLGSWGEGILLDAHGIYIDDHDIIYCVERNTHVLRKFTTRGRLLMTLGTPGVPAEREGEPFNGPTDVCLSPDGYMYVSDGYGNARVHKFTLDGKHVLSWGEAGSGPGQFDLSHDVWVLEDGRVLCCDRENNRIQVFDGEGRYLTSWTDVVRPDGVYVDSDGIIYVAEVAPRVSVRDGEGRVLSRFGEAGEAPGQFSASPHGIWVDSRGDLYVSEVGADHRLQKFARVR